MVGVSAVSLSGLYASEKRLAVSADNIANADSTNYKAKDVVQSTDDSGGVQARVVDRNPATITVPTNDGGTKELPNVDLAEEVVQAQVASYNAQANLKVLQTQNKLDKYLLDIQA